MFAAEVLVLFVPKVLLYFWLMSKKTVKNSSETLTCFVATSLLKDCEESLFGA